MSSFNIVVQSPVTKTSRVKQLSAMFDVPLNEVAQLEWSGDLSLDDFDWQVGLIVGPSGSGKTTIAQHIFGPPRVFRWAAKSVIDDFAKRLSIEDIATVCQSVGFNTIPAWMRPFKVLSTGEQFRVTMARHLLESSDPIVMDEFTSVVDRQVAKIGAHAVQKYVRKNARRFVAVSCHYDIVDWLQPDWIFEPAVSQFTRRSLRQRPTLDAYIAHVPYTAWEIFAPFHYLTNNLNRAARCFVLFVNDQPASFAGMLHRPHPKVKDVIGLSRLVTLPDWQGFGLAMILSDTLGAAYRAIGKRLHMYPAHPSLIHAFDRSPRWSLKKRPGVFSGRPGRTSTLRQQIENDPRQKLYGRPCAVFEYHGETMPLDEARALLDIESK